MQSRVHDPQVRVHPKDGEQGLLRIGTCSGRNTRRGYMCIHGAAGVMQSPAVQRVMP